MNKLIIISIDALRADSLSCYGYEKITSPYIDEIAREGVLFRNAYTQANWTNPSYYSLITGLYPLVHGIARFDQKLESKVVTLPEFLSGRGYKSFLLSNYYTLIDRKGFGSHFQEAEFFDIDRDDEKLRQKLSSLKDQDVFMLIHIGNYVHEPYCAPEKLVREFWKGDFPGKKVITSLTKELGLDDESMRNVLRSINLRKISLSPREVSYLKARYDAGIKYVDKWVGDFFRFLQDNIKEDTLLVITADHGQGFFEHGFFGHGLGLNEELIKVPLIFWRREKLRPGKVRTPVQLIDLFPTITEVLKLPPDLDIDGVSFKKCLQGMEDKNRIAFCEGFPFVTCIYNFKKLIISFYQVMPRQKRLKEIWNLVLKRRWRKLLLHLYSIFKAGLYDLSRDQGEKQNLIKSDRACARQMKELIKNWYVKGAAKSKQVETEEIDDYRIIEQLKNLGYL